MALAFLLALQAAAAPAPPEDFDLARVVPAGPELGGPVAGCRRDVTEAIIVCGRRPGIGDYPIEQWERVFAERPLVAEKKFGRATARAFVEGATLGNGMISNRVMVGIKLPF